MIVKVLDLVMSQIGDLRIPMREEELRQQLRIIYENIHVLRDSVAEAKEKAEQEADAAEKEEQEAMPSPTDGAAETIAEEVTEDV